MTQPNRLAADAAHQFGGIELDRGKPLQFKLNGRRLSGYAGDTVLSAALANGVDTFGTYDTLPIGLTNRYAPLVAPRRAATDAAPMDRWPVRDGDDLVSLGRRTPSRLFRRTPHSMRHALAELPDAPWLRATPETSLTADLVIVGGGVAGLAAAEAAAAAGHTVAIVERRPWFGGDARYFGAVGDDESPEAVTLRLLTRLAADPGVTLLGNAEAFAIHGTTVLAHHLESKEAGVRGRVVALVGQRLLLATGTLQRLPVFPGNRLPGVVSAISAYHLAKRYGVSPRTAIIATQGNLGYRLALRLNDAGVGIRRIVDTRLNPQSRFVDFSKASGLNLASGQYPLSASAGPQARLTAVFANGNTAAPALERDADGLIVAGTWQPDITLWMLAGGGARWNAQRGRLDATGQIEHVALAGAVAGWRTLKACLESGAAAADALFGQAANDVEDDELDAMFETPDAPTAISPITAASAFLDAGASLAQREPSPSDRRAALGLGDVAAGVELGQITPVDAGTIAEERGAPGADLPAGDWPVPPRPAPKPPTCLAGRFGADPVRLHLVVDGKRRFEVGAQVFAAGTPPDPVRAIGAIVEAADIGGIALMSATALATTDRLVVETSRGPSPARIRPAE